MKRLLRLTGSITLGTLLFQTGSALCLLSVSYFVTVPAAAEFATSFAMAQLLGIALTFGLTSAVVAENDQDEARLLSGVMVVVALLGALIILPIFVFFEGQNAFGITVFGISLALCEALRSEAIGSLKIRTALLNFIGLALTMALLGFAFILSGKIFISFFLSGCLLAGVWIVQRHFLALFEITSIVIFFDRFCVHWRYFIFRTATIILDFLSSKGIILLMGGLPSSYVLFFFLVQRIIALPVQHLTYALSLSLLRQARSEKAAETSQTVKKVWRAISIAGGVLLPIASLALGIATKLSLPFTFSSSEAIVSLALIFYTFYLSYVSWLGRLFDLNKAQALAFKVEVITKLAFVLVLYQIARYAPLDFFAPTFFLLQTVFGGFWLMALFQRMRWELAFLVRGFLVPVAGITGISTLIFLFILAN